MKNTKLCLCVLIYVSLISSIVFSQEKKLSEPKEYRNPAVFEKDMQQFAKQDSETSPPLNAVLCVGSSSMKGWHKTIKEDLAPLTVIPRGFGGSNMNELLYYTDRAVLPYKPRAILVYEGDNDIPQGISPEKVKDTFLLFVKKVHSELPEARIYFISIKPSESRWKFWEKAKEANKLIELECSKDKRLTFIDVAAGMIDANGQVKKELFLNDKLHMNRQGYLLWKDIVGKVLIEKEKQYEPSGKMNQAK